VNFVLLNENFSTKNYFRNYLTAENLREGAFAFCLLPQHHWASR